MIKIKFLSDKEFKAEKEINYVIENFKKLKKIMNRTDMSECENCQEMLWGIFLSIESLEQALYLALTIIENEIYNNKEGGKNE